MTTGYQTDGLSGENPEQPMTIVELRAENVKRLQAVTVRPDGELVVVGGRNAQGKSSLLDSIAYAIGGPKLMPERVVRDGQRDAAIRLDLGRLVVTRKMTAKGQSVVVTDADGATVSSPQTLLNRLCESVAFDPLAFTRMDGQKQMEAVRRVVGLDFTDLDKRRSIAYGQRTEVNRDAKRVAGSIAEMPRYPGSATRVDVSEIQERLLEAEAGNRKAQTARGRYSAAEAEVQRRREVVARLVADLQEAEADLLGGEAQLEEWRPRIEALATVDTTQLVERMAQAGTINEQVGANERRAAAEAELAEMEREAERFTAEIAKVDEEKQARLAGAKWPVPGLSFDESGLLLNGVPFEQASSAERLRVSMAMALATNPTLRVCLIRDGSLLDAEQLGNVAMIAAECGAQVWVERVGAGDECSVVIEDGLVSEDRTSTGGEDSGTEARATEDGTRTNTDEHGRTRTGTGNGHTGNGNGGGQTGGAA